MGCYLCEFCLYAIVVRGKGIDEFDTVQTKGFFSLKLVFRLMIISLTKLQKNAL